MKELIKRLREEELSRETALEAADAIKHLLKIGTKMHLWIWEHCINEDEVYAEIGLTDEDNFLLGYGGKITITISDENNEERR